MLKVVAFGVGLHRPSAKMGHFSVGTLNFLLNACRKRADVFNFAQFFVEIKRETRRNFKYKF